MTKKEIIRKYKFYKSIFDTEEQYPIYMYLHIICNFLRDYYFAITGEVLPDD